MKRNNLLLVTALFIALGPTSLMAGDGSAIAKRIDEMECPITERQDKDLLQILLEILSE